MAAMLTSAEQQERPILCVSVSHHEAHNLQIFGLSIVY